MRVRVFVLAVAALLLSACSSGESENTANANPPTWLIALNGEFTTESRDGSTYLLVSDPTGARLFSERPQRVSVPITPNTIVALWQLAGFSEVPPNAAIIATNSEPVIATLSNPAWTAREGIRFLIPEPATLSVSGSGSMVIDATNPVNSQVTDAITTTNVKVLGESPAIALGNLYQTVGNSVAMAAANKEYQQEQANTQTPPEINATIEQILNMTGGQGTPGATTPTD